ncbi:MAG: class I SAM-dependent methyltransferase [Cyclobacteriaceae bacterium]
MKSCFSYDRIASVYDLLSYFAFFGRIQQAQRYYLSQIPDGSNVLFLGGGTGWLLPDLFLSSHSRHITYIEASANMLLKAQNTVLRFQRQHPNTPIPSITFIYGTEQQIPFSSKYDVAITNFLLDMYSGSDLLTLVNRISKHLTDEAIWLFSDFHLSEHPRQRIWQKPLLSLMYYFFHLTAGIAIQPLPDFADVFGRFGWRSTHGSTFYQGFIRSQVYRRTKDVIPDAVAEDR